MAWRAVTDTQWKLIEAHFPSVNQTSVAVVRASVTANASRVSYGYCGRAPHGANCRRGTAPRVPSTAASQHGLQAESSCTYGALSWTN